MNSKNRTIRSFLSLVPDYARSKCERYEANIQRCLQVMCCMENLSTFDTKQPDTIELFINIKELLRICDSKSCIGWKTIELLKHLSQDKKIKDLILEMEFVPVLSQYCTSQMNADRLVLLLATLEPLTEGIIVERAGLWLGSLLKHLTHAILEKSEYTLPYLLAVLSNFCLENHVVVNELQRECRSDELLQYLMQLQASDPLIQLHASQVVFSLLAVGSISETLLKKYVGTVVHSVEMGARNGHLGLIKRCGLILRWMSRDRLIVDMIHSSNFQDLLRETLEGLIPVLVDSNDVDTINTVLVFMASILRTRLVSSKKFTEAFITPLIPLLHKLPVTESLLELLVELFKNITPATGLSQVDEENLAKLSSKVVEKIEQFQDPSSSDSCRALGHALQILQKLFKISPSTSRMTSTLRPETFVRIVSSFVVLSEPEEKQSNRAPDASILIHPYTVKYSAEAISIVVESLTLLGQIVSCGRGGEWLQHYSYLLGEANVQQCLASAIMQGDCHIKQATLALIGTLGFSADSVSGLSLALNQMCTISNDGARSISGGKDWESSSSFRQQSLTHWTLPPAQSHKIDMLIEKMKIQDKFWENMKQCEVLELMELQMERGKREQRELRANLDVAHQEMNSYKVAQMQLQAENDRMMAMVLARSEMVENKAAENRGLTRRLEEMQQRSKKDEAMWKGELERLKHERERQERAHLEAEGQLKSQLDSAKKQINDLIAKNEAIDGELEAAKKNNENLKLMVEKRERKLERLIQDFNELQAQAEKLQKSLAKREKEVEEKEREIGNLKQSLKKSEMMREDVERRLVESEKSAQETKEKLTKLEKIQEFIFELSSGKKTIFESK